MNTSLLWTSGIALSVALHAGILVAVPRAFAPEPVADQPIPRSEMQVETQAVARSESSAIPPPADSAAATSAAGANLAQGSIPQSRATATPPEMSRLAPAAPPPDTTVAASSPPPPATAAAPTPATLAPATPSASAITAAPPPAAPVASTAPAAPALSAAPTGTQALAAVLSEPASLAAAPPPSAQPTVAPATPSLAAATPAVDTVTAASDTPPVLAPATPPESAITAAPPPAAPVVSTAPAAPTLSAAPTGTQPLAAALSEPASLAAAPPPPAQPTSAPETQSVSQSAPPADPLGESSPEAERITAELAFTGADDIALDPQALATIQSFMQPGDPGSAAAEARDALEALLSQVPCSRLQAEFDPDNGTIALRGHIPDEDLRAPVLAALQAQVGQGITVTDAMLILPRPQCGALAGIGAVGLPQSTDQVTNSRIAGNDAHARVFAYRGGDSLLLEMQAPDYDAYVYVDYYDADGNVIHLVPNDIVPLILHPAQSAMIVGRAADGQPALEITIGPPFGQEIAVAFAASSPLYDGLRPTVEEAGPYLSWLAERVAEARAADPGFKGEWVYFFISTRAE
jgi:hypothetical protein